MCPLVVRSVSTAAKLLSPPTPLGYPCGVSPDWVQGELLKLVWPPGPGEARGGMLRVTENHWPFQLEESRGH